ncbi:MAG: hypothetical protein C0507_02025 [Cyanobacteria bacterium PR.3.49]|nr:hypothetical protein [Cyanobacteria bacterium PR.3.49]
MSLRQRAEKPALAALVCTGLLAVSLLAQSAAAETTTSQTKPGKPSMIPTAEPDKPVVFNPKNLRRLDFKVQGKSCAVCLMGIQKKVKAMPGIIKVAVMLKRPYGAVVIYDFTKVSAKDILEKAKKEDKEVKIVEPTDFSIQKVPTILIPLYGIPKSPEIRIASP